ncbi:helix-turn-helix transcriptional regulator [Anaerosporobacter faecicola]|uniref:helix-turn-helix transcriptional regulator n=1 Tax=Anaerosporobacter faecicola TaxID=2718714 RepID=UPI00143ADE72|nr:AraC family transcriptional regulator [Anaerosporobacter faecicola]
MDHYCIEKIKKYIEMHFSEEISLDHLAKKFGYSKYHLSRMFAETTGMTIHTYIVERRLQEAQQLLMQTKTPIVDIAQLVGYTSQQSFTKAFRNRFLYTPAYVRSNCYVRANKERTRMRSIHVQRPNTLQMRLERIAA